MSHAIYSMTGYGRTTAEHEDWSWVWEVRAVNGKALDMRLRLPSGFERMDPLVRKAVARRIKRGNLQISLALNKGEKSASFSIDHSWIDYLMREGEEIRSKYGLAKPSLDGLYRTNGVLIDTDGEMEPKEFALRQSKILQSLDDMMDALIVAREQEGTAMGKLLRANVDEFTALNAKAKQCASTQPTAIQAKLTARINELLPEGLSEERMAQEIAVLAQKADVREEVDRLDAHIEQAGQLLDKGSPIGRKLDFLSQEFIREINTLCSKSADIDLTRIGLEMKTLLEQFREQAANVE